MALFRPARQEDLSAIATVTAQAEPGMTNLPRTKTAISDRIEQTAQFIDRSATSNCILFVVERQGRVDGISVIIPALGRKRPFYSFRKNPFDRRSATLNHSLSVDTLTLTTYFNGYVELATLFIAPWARGEGLGRLLSYGRLSFIHAHRDRFGHNLMADIRGWTDSRGNSPFWRHLASKFIPLSFGDADKRSVYDGSFISELLPELPILLNLLPDTVSDCIGMPHNQARAAYHMLTEAGFEWNGLCDVFDGGPSLECRTDATLLAQTNFEVEVVDSNMAGDSVIIWTGHGAEFFATTGVANRSARCARPTDGFRSKEHTSSIVKAALLQPKGQKSMVCGVTNDGS